jgi:serine/threonine protein kinase
MPTKYIPPSFSQPHGLANGSNLITELSTVGGVIGLVTIFVLSFWCWNHRRRTITPREQQSEYIEGSVSPLFPDSNFTSLRLIEKIGIGRFSEVWRASLNDNLVAVKVFPEKEKQSWSTEKDIYMHPEIKHENLRGFLAARCNADESSTTYWMILDYHEMGSLRDYLKSNVLTFENVCKMAQSIAAGLAYLHLEVNEEKPAIAHRDVKSSNVLVKRDLTCCVCDLGLSIKFQPGASITEAQGQVSSILCTTIPTHH